MSKNDQKGDNRYVGRTECRGPGRKRQDYFNAVGAMEQLTQKDGGIKAAASAGRVSANIGYDV